MRRAGKSLEALYAAKQKNPKLQVTLFVDFHRAQRGLVGEGKKAGNAAFYRKIKEKYRHHIDILGVPVKSRELFGVLHMKGFIFDHQVLYSGASLNDVYLHQSEKYRYDRYYLLNAPDLAEVMVRFLNHHFIPSHAVQSLDVESIPTIRSLKKSIKLFKRVLKHEKYQFTDQVLAGKQVGVTPLVGLGKRGNQLNRSIRNLLRSTKEHLILFTPYFNLPRSLAKDIKELLRKGVTVSLVVGDKKANDFFIPEEEPFSKIGALPYLYECNLKHFAQIHDKAISQGLLRIHLWRHDGHSFHLKGINADFRYHLLTGNNLNPQSLGAGFGEWIAES